MPTWTLVEAKTNLALWKDALAAISTGQSYTIHGRSLTRASLKEVMDMIKYFEKIISDVERQDQGLGPRRKVRRYVPMDT